MKSDKIFSPSDIEIIRSDRKTCVIEIADDLHIILRLPKRYPQSAIAPLLARHKKWITEARIRKSEKNRKYPELSDEECDRLYRRACEVLPKKTEYYSELTGLVPTGLKITAAKKRFGSCSGKNSICFSYRLMRYPEPAIDYVVLHELAHIKHHNHSKEFYSLIESYMPDYKERAAMLKR